MTDPRPIRPTPPARPSPGMPAARPVAGAAPRPQRAKPDPNALRLLVALGGIATASALVTAMLPSITPALAADTTTTDTTGTTALGPEPSVQHVTRYVTLAPGQTAPPNTAVVVKPQPTPRVTVKVVTKQSGKP